MCIYIYVCVCVIIEDYIYIIIYVYIYIYTYGNIYKFSSNQAWDINFNGSFIQSLTLQVRPMSSLLTYSDSCVNMPARLAP